LLEKTCRLLRAFFFKKISVFRLNTPPEGNPIRIAGGGLFSLKKFPFFA
jgi:hypothetical protein